MKKIIMGIIFLISLVVLFFISTFYINSINEKIFNQISKNTDYYQVEDINYTKNFLNSKGSFKILLNDLPYIFTINIDFSNIFFASNNAKISIINENEDINDFFTNKEIMKIFVNIKTHDKIAINAKFNDINTTKDNKTLLIKNFDIHIDLKEKFVEKIQLDINHFLFEDDYKKLELKNAQITEFPFEGLKFEDIFNSSHNGEQKINIELIDLQDAIINTLKADIKTTINANNDYDGLLKLNINRFQAPFKDFSLDNINVDLNFTNLSKKAYDQYLQSNGDFFSMMILFSQFLKSDPEFFLNDFSFLKEEKKFQAKAQALIKNNNIKTQANIKSELLPSQINPQFNNFDMYFVDNNGSYTLDFNYDDTNKSDIKIILNGEEFNSNL
ncbi:DUF945 domain-containing protein [Campylobacter volucris]|uniref:DUF945 domain-containing protein n=1 Tax=Campylobacter volucris TaxID=1031542 RepID=A0A5C7DTL7_9BACT|nr:DUF945 domain-containing protein [Campylobacter volucris]TXE88175.1 DUF945 domain-containing protein [Campylobacter volucris]